MPYVYHGWRFLANCMTYSYSEVIRNLETFMARRGINYSLENFERLLYEFGNPHKQLPPIIHIAGTNGKGSTAAFLEEGLLSMGKNVGVYTSPHLESYTERLRINRTAISEEEFSELFSELLATLNPSSIATEFELLTLGAFLWFLEKMPDVIILETGLGGRLDATNVVTPLVSVITRIDFDHQAILGETLAEIAREKAGIIKQNRPVITLSNQESDALSVIQKQADQKQAKLYLAKKAPIDSEFTYLKGQHQFENAGLALEVLHILGYECAFKHLKNAKNPGRFEIMRFSEKTVIRDGAHNPSGIKVLIENLKYYVPNQPLAIVTGILKTKDAKAMLLPLLTCAEVVYYIDFWPGNSYSGSEILALAPSEKLKILTNMPTIAELNHPVIVVTGSLHFIGAFKQPI